MYCKLESEIKMNEILQFGDFPVRRAYDEKKQAWYFSVTDVLHVLLHPADYQTSRKYWNKLKSRLNQEGSETVTDCHQLKMTAEDGKNRMTDVADIQTLFRIIQSVPSPKAEPIKLWLAKVGYERLQESVDPELSLNRARENWQQHGRSDKWIQQRMTGQETRNKLTDYWKDHGVEKSSEFAILTNIIHKEWSDLTVQEHKELKGLKTQNLRDHMNEAELIFTALAELSTRQIAETMDAHGIKENKEASKVGGGIAKQARKTLEQKTGINVISGENYLIAKPNKK
jgi:DNA-damage-inducible protein D